MHEQQLKHLAQIVGAGALSETVLGSIQVPSPSEMQAIGSVIVQFLVAAVTIWATIRKAIQKPVIKQVGGSNDVPA